MSSNTAVLDGSKPELVQARVSTLKKPYEEEKGVDHVEHSGENLVYDDNDKEPELHARTYLALVAMFLLSFVQVVALQGPPAVVCVILSNFFWLDKADISFSALIHRKRPEQHAPANLDPQQPCACPGGDRSCNLFRIRYLSGTKDNLGRRFHDIIHRCSHCSWLRKYLPTDRCTNLNWLWVCYHPIGILRSE